MSTRPQEPSSVNIELTDSQNFFNSMRTRLKFLRGVYLLYTIAFIPAILNLILLKNLDDYKEFVDNYPGVLCISAFISIVLSLMLALSKIVARKQPVNVIAYIIFVIVFAYTMGGLGVFYGKSGMLIFTIMLGVNALALLTYSYIVQTRFVLKEAIFFVVGFLIITVIAFRFRYNEKVIANIVSFIFALFISTIIMCASEFMTENKNFTMLPNDYIMGSMKLMTVMPLIEEFTVYDSMVGPAHK